MNPDTQNELVYSRSVIEFLTVANEFCVFTEKSESYSINDVLSFYQKILPLLYVKGSLLPVIIVNDEVIAERYVNEEQWEEVFQKLNTKFEKADSFTWLLKNDFNEFVPVVASLADTISDVYQDMKDFVMLYQKGTHHAKENAVNECRKLFASHWGERAIKAQAAIHDLIFNETGYSNEE